MCLSCARHMDTELNELPSPLFVPAHLSILAEKPTCMYVCVGDCGYVCMCVEARG